MLVTKRFKTVALLFFFISSFMSYGQILQIGLKGGINYSDFEKNSYNTKAITSYHIGPTVNFKLFKGVALQADVLYSTVGGKYKKPVDQVFNEYKNKLGYISLPLALQVHIRENIFIEAGPQFSFLLSNKDDFNLGNENSYDLGYFGGIGFRLFKNLNIGVRYVGGTKNVYPEIKSRTSLTQAYLEIKF